MVTRALLLSVLALAACATTKRPAAPADPTALMTAAIDLYSTSRFEDVVQLFAYPSQTAEVRDSTAAGLGVLLSIVHRHLGPIVGQQTPFDGANSITVTLSSAETSDWKQIEDAGGVFTEVNSLVEYGVAGPGCVRGKLYFTDGRWALRNLQFGVLLARDDWADVIAPIQVEMGDYADSLDDPLTMRGDSTGLPAMR